MASNATKNRIMWIVLLICAIGVVGVVYFTDQAIESTAPDPAQQALPQVGNTSGSSPFVSAPQPPGDAPPGKVWSVEHGHWHDSANPNLQTTIQAGESTSVFPSFTPAQQPDGDPPTGKVWSAEHGHWHDAPGQSTITQPTSILPGVAAPSPPPTFTPAPQPPGDPPPGKIWNEPHGHWHDDPAQTGTSQFPTIRQIEVKPKDTP